MEYLNFQLSKFKDYLKSEVGIPEKDLESIGSKIEGELLPLTKAEIERIINHSPIDLNHRYDELIAFQRMMDFLRNNQINEPGLIRSQVITQNYICFVYLKDSYFKALQNEFQKNTVIHRCCKFLTSARIRKFRNSIAHGNWNYKHDFRGLEYWDFINGNRNNGYEKFEVDEKELSFWQTLSRVVAYSTIVTINDKTKG